MIYYTCNWHKNTNRCVYRATQIIIYGCLEQHIDETLFCYTHSVAWRDDFHGPGYYCQICHQRLEDYELILLSRAKHSKPLAALQKQNTTR